MFAEVEKFDYEQFAKHAVVAHEKLLVFKKGKDRLGFACVFVYKTFLFLFSVCNECKISAQLSPCELFLSLRLTSCCMRPAALAMLSAVAVLTCDVLFPNLLFMTLPFDCIMVSKRKCDSDSEARKKL
jgi:hypothetical protein